MQRLTLLLAVSLVILTAARAGADTVQPIGPLVALRILNNASDEVGIYGGFITVGDSIGGYQTYFWEGSRCPALTFTDGEIAVLQRGMNNPRILIQPFTKVGQGGTLCLVAFTLVLRSDLGALP
jgi:hypothetical protein